MNRYVFLHPKKKFGPALVLEFIKAHGGLTPAQITFELNRRYGMVKTLPEVYVVIALLKRQRKIKAKNHGNSKKSQTYEAA